MKSQTQKSRFLPAFDTLEQREVMSATSVAVSSGTLMITCDDAADNLEIRRVEPVLTRGPITEKAAGARRLVTLPQFRIEVTDKTLTTNNKYSFRLADVQRIEVQLQGGDDRLDSTAGLPTTVYAGAGNDNVLTGAAVDIILGGLGNDFINAGGGGDSLFGEDGNDTLLGGLGNDVIYGGAGFNTLRGEGNDDFISASGRSDIVDGGPGYDRFQLVAKNVNPTQNGEDITIQVPQDQPQDDGWSCGPNSASRFLRAYGINVSYNTLRNQVQENSLVSKFHLGTLPGDLRYAISQHRALTSLETESNQARVLKLLREGKPVIALVATDKVGIGALGVTVGHYGLMHYVVLNGFDQATQTIRYVDTDGLAKTWSYSEFDYHWRWFDHFTGVGEAAQTFLYGLGMRKRSLIV